MKKRKKTELREKTEKNGNGLFKNGILKFLKRKIPMSEQQMYDRKSITIVILDGILLSVMLISA